MDGWMCGRWIYGYMGWAWGGLLFHFYFLKISFFCTFVRSPYVGSVFYCISLFGGLDGDISLQFNGHGTNYFF